MMYGSLFILLLELSFLVYGAFAGFAVSSSCLPCRTGKPIISTEAAPHHHHLPKNDDDKDERSKADESDRYESSSSETTTEAASVQHLMDKAATSEGISLQELYETNFDVIRRAVVGTKNDGSNSDDTTATRIVLIGEATHGTEEFFRIRADLTKSLLHQQMQQGDDDEYAFDAVICEGEVAAFQEWNQWIVNTPSDDDSTTRSHKTSKSSVIPTHQQQAPLHQSWPEWMGANDCMMEFCEWLREFNHCNRLQQKQHSPSVQLLGMDILQGMFPSMDAVVDRLEQLQRLDLAELARQSYSQLNNFRPDPREYGKAIYSNAVSSQHDAVTYVLETLEQEASSNRFAACQPQGGKSEATLYYELVENARVVQASEAYYRQFIFPGYPVTWNLRDAAFLDAIQRAMAFLQQQEPNQRPVRVIVWAHNSHVGDAGATGYYTERGQNSLGQLCRQFFGKEHVYIIGFTTNTGSVRAARQERGKDQVLQLNPALPTSHESLLHMISKIRGQNAFGYSLRGTSTRSGNDHIDIAAQELFGMERLERFVGSSYHPATEFQSHYSTARMSEQFDFLLHVDQTTALRVDYTVR